MLPEISQFLTDDYKAIAKTITPKTIWQFSIPHLIQLSRAASHVGDFRIAELAEREILRRKPGNIKTHIALAVMLERQNKFKEALELRLAVKVVTPDDQENLRRVEFLKLQTELIGGKINAAALYGQLCTADLTTCPIAQLEYCIIEATSRGDSPNLLRFAEEFIRQVPAHTFGYIYKAIALEMLRRFEEALAVREYYAEMLSNDKSRDVNNAAIQKLRRKVQSSAGKVIL